MVMVIAVDFLSFSDYFIQTASSGLRFFLSAFLALLLSSFQTVATLDESVRRSEQPTSWSHTFRWVRQISR